MSTRGTHTHLDTQPAFISCLPSVGWTQSWPTTTRMGMGLLIGETLMSNTQSLIDWIFKEQTWLNQLCITYITKGLYYVINVGLNFASNADLLCKMKCSRMYIKYVDITRYCYWYFDRTQRGCGTSRVNTSPVFLSIPFPRVALAPSGNLIVKITIDMY